MTDEQRDAFWKAFNEIYTHRVKLADYKQREAATKWCNETLGYTSTENGHTYCFKTKEELAEFSLIYA